VRQLIVGTVLGNSESLWLGSLLLVF